MNRILHVVASAALAMLPACGKNADAPPPASAQVWPAVAQTPAIPAPKPHEPPPIKGKRDADGYYDLDWLEMMPAADLAALKNPPPIRHVGSLRTQQGGSFNVIAALDGQSVKLPGYVVPPSVMRLPSSAVTVLKESNCGAGWVAL